MESGLLSMAQEFSGLPMEALIGGPLNAAAKANAAMAVTQTNFLLSTCFNLIHVPLTPAEPGSPAVVDPTTGVVTLSATYSGAATIKVKGMNECGEGAFSSELTLNVKPLALVPGIPTGVTSVNSKTTVSSDFTTTGGLNAETYAWIVDPSSAGVFSGTGTTGTIAWTMDYKGNFPVKCLEPDFHGKCLFIRRRRSH